MSMIEKHAAAYSEIHTLLEFLDWLGREGMEVAKRGEYRLQPITEGQGDMVFRYLGIDKVQLEAERQGLLTKQRELNARLDTLGARK